MTNPRRYLQNGNLLQVRPVEGPRGGSPVRRWGCRGLLSRRQRRSLGRGRCGCGGEGGSDEADGRDDGGGVVAGGGAGRPCALARVGRMRLVSSRGKVRKKQDRAIPEGLTHGKAASVGEGGEGGRRGAGGRLRRPRMGARLPRRRRLLHRDPLLGQRRPVHSNHRVGLESIKTKRKLEWRVPSSLATPW